MGVLRPHPGTPDGPHHCGVVVAVVGGDGGWDEAAAVDVVLVIEPRAARERGRGRDHRCRDGIGQGRHAADARSVARDIHDIFRSSVVLQSEKNTKTLRICFLINKSTNERCFKTLLPFDILTNMFLFGKTN